MLSQSGTGSSSDDNSLKYHFMTTILGQAVPVSIYYSFDISNIDIQNSIEAAVNVINLHTEDLSDFQSSIIKNIKSITVNDPDIEFSSVNVRTGNFNILSKDLSGTGADPVWIASNIGHEGYHVFQHQNGIENDREHARAVEQGADQFQIQVGRILGLRQYQIDGLENDTHTYYKMKGE